MSALRPNQIHMSPKLGEKGRVSFISFFTKTKPEGSQAEAKYSGKMLFAKDDATLVPLIARFRAVEDLVAGLTWGPNKDVMLKTCKRRVLSDGDDTMVFNGLQNWHASMRGNWVLTAKSTNPIRVVAADGSPITSGEGLYAGGYAAYDVLVNAYNKGGDHGINVILLGVQWLGGGKRIGVECDGFEAVAPEPSADNVDWA